MSAPTEAELNRPIPEPDPAWACKVTGCREPVPADVEDQPHCEACHVPVCEKHAWTKLHVRYCRECIDREHELMNRIGLEMFNVSFRARDWSKTDLNDIQATCERWMKEIGEVL